MKAIVWTKYGSPDGLELKEIEKPIPERDEVLVRVHATTVTAGDSELRRLELPLMLSFPMRLYVGLIRPVRITVLGQELAGEIVEVGDDVKAFKKGDQIFGTTGFGFGAYAEYICLKAEPDEMQGTIDLKPVNNSYAEAAAVPTAGFEALHFLKKADIQRGQKLLILGAGGSIGTFAVQLAKYYGAEVTAVDHSRKLETLCAIGADHVVDYTREDFTQNGERYDVIIDVVGKKSFARRLKSLKPNGHYFLANAGLSHVLLGWWTGLTSSKKVILRPSAQTKAALRFLRQLIEAGKLKTVIDRYYPLDQVPEAHRYVETGQKIGNVVILVREPE